MQTNKLLYIATSDIHLKGFHQPYIKWLTEQEIQVDMAVENRGNLVIPEITHSHYLEFPRSLFKKQLFTSYKELKRIIDEGNYDIVHCHTPIPSMLTRLASRRARRKGTKVLYTSHGFHFYKGGPLSRWFTYYLAEWFLSKFTDGIVTINQEDFDTIQNKLWLHKDSFFIKGIGVDSSKFRPFDENERKKKRKELGLLQDDFVLLYVAEFIPRKNHQFILKTLPKLKAEIPQLKVLFAGKGILEEQMKQLSKNLKIEEVVSFLGFRKDVPELAAISDVGISSSKHEGLGLGLTEEMFCKVPIVASYDRGHKEMIIQGETGFMFQQGNSEEFIEYINRLYLNNEQRITMGEKAYEKAQEFEISNSLNSMIQIYRKYLTIQ